MSLVGVSVERYKRYLKNGSPIQIQRQYAIRPESGSTKYNSTMMTCRPFQGNSWRWWRRWRTSCTRTLPRRRSSRAMYCTLAASLLHNYCLLTAIITSTGLFTASGHFDTPLISVVDSLILKPFGVVIVITGWFGLVYNNAWQVVRYLCKYCIKFGQILQQMKFPGHVRKSDIY